MVYLHASGRGTDRPMYGRSLSGIAILTRTVITQCDFRGFVDELLKSYGCYKQKSIVIRTFDFYYACRGAA